MEAAVATAAAATTTAREVTMCLRSAEACRRSIVAVRIEKVGRSLCELRLYALSPLLLLVPRTRARGGTGTAGLLGGDPLAG